MNNSSKKTNKTIVRAIVVTILAVSRNYGEKNVLKIAFSLQTPQMLLFLNWTFKLPCQKRKRLALSSCRVPYFPLRCKSQSWMCIKIFWLDCRNHMLGCQHHHASQKCILGRHFTASTNVFKPGGRNTTGLLGPSATRHCRKMQG